MHISCQILRKSMLVATSFKGECPSELSEESPANQMDMRFFVVALLRMASIRIIFGWKLSRSL